VSKEIKMDEEKCTVTLTTVVPHKNLYPHLLGQSSNGVESFPPRTFGINVGRGERMAILGRVLTKAETRALVIREAQKVELRRGEGSYDETSWMFEGSVWGVKASPVGESVTFIARLGGKKSGCHHMRCWGVCKTR